jgi:peptidyl-prolyl cis-trans isomerase B (cyclophilin B)
VRRLLALPLTCLALATAACGEEDGTSARQAAPKATGTATPAAAACAEAAQPAPRRGGDLSAPKRRLDPGREWTARVATSCGTFTIGLDARRDPKTSASFAALARRGFYDGLTFHRVVPGFVIQGGDPRGDGTGDPGYRVVERPRAGTTYTRGVVAMAKTGQEAAGTSGSQFFVVTAEDAQLPPDYAVVGRVTGGLGVVQRIEAVPTDSQDRPRAPVVIRSVRVASR